MKLLFSYVLKGASSMEEHLPYKKEVGGLIPLCPTIKKEVGGSIPPCPTIN
jgi:hypothetical protein